MMRILSVFCLMVLASGGLLSCRPAASNTKNAETLDRLNKALKCETLTSHEYAKFAEKAEAEGILQIAKLFRASSKARAIHRNSLKTLIKKMGANPEEVTVEELSVGTTLENLGTALRGETYKFSVLYPEFIAHAIENENGKEAVELWSYITDVSSHHMNLYTDAMVHLMEPNAPETTFFVCLFCGDTLTELPEKCPVCHRDKEEFAKTD